uniref:FUZ/MON1/HPS1 first Longin domain-containing protein n=1 Tax=Spongospora subterranea TaxID=70186 RepID=A0A0H5RCF3_9EUKA|eukprot:CRZ11431.1 hypothetical protein [Spongospora subterranea]
MWVLPLVLATGNLHIFELYRWCYWSCHMGCCWMAIVSSAGMPIFQYSSDGIDTPFAIQGLLTALQTSTQSYQCQVDVIHTKTASIAYLIVDDTMFICCLNTAYQWIAQHIIASTRSSISLAGISMLNASAAEVRKEIQSVSPMITRLIGKGNPSTSWIGLPQFTLCEKVSHIENMISVASSISEYQQAAIIHNHNIMCCSPEWLALDPEEMWAILHLYKSCESTEPVTSFTIYLKDDIGNPTRRRELVAVHITSLVVLIVLPEEGTDISEIDVALNVFRVENTLPVHIKMDSNIQGYFYLYNGVFVETYFAWNDTADRLHDILLRTLGEHLTDNNIEVKERPELTMASDEQYQVENDAVLYLIKRQSSILVVALSREIPPSCYRGIANITAATLNRRFSEVAGLQ